MNTLSLDQLIKLLYDITGMRVTLSNSSFRGLISFPGFQSYFCNAIQRSKECHAACRKSDKQSFERCADLKSVYSYRCPFGLIEIVMPICSNNKTVGYLMMGQAIEDSETAENTLLETLQKYFPDSAERHNQIISEIPRIKKEHADAYCKLLTMITQYIESNDICHFPGKTLGTFIKNYIKDNIENQITLEGLALNLHCSQSTITGTFRKEFDKTVMQYVKEKRMEHARNLLKDHSVSIKEAALRCGFSDPGYFTKTFTQQFGISPTEWRKELLLLREIK